MNVIKFQQLLIKEAATKPASRYLIGRYDDQIIIANGLIAVSIPDCMWYLDQSKLNYGRMSGDMIKNLLSYESDLRLGLEGTKIFIKEGKKELRSLYAKDFNMYVDTSLYKSFLDIDDYDLYHSGGPRSLIKLVADSEVKAVICPVYRGDNK